MLLLACLTVAAFIVKYKEFGGGKPSVLVETLYCFDFWAS
jgi:hypothetical protein